MEKQQENNIFNQYRSDKCDSCLVKKLHWLFVHENLFLAIEYMMTF